MNSIIDNAKIKEEIKTKKKIKKQVMAKIMMDAKQAPGKYVENYNTKRGGE